jgi:hypothetical protein
MFIQNLHATGFIDMLSLRTASFCAGLILLSGFSTASAQSFATPDPAPIVISREEAPPPLSPLVSRRIQRDLAQRLNAAPESIMIIEATPETWPDHCLGLGRPNQRCIGGEVRGWRVQVASAQQQWVYRSDRSGRRLAIEPLAGTPDFGSGEFSAETGRLLLETVSQQVDQPVENLEILEVQPATWNGCLGIFVPDQACTMIAMSGFRTIVSDGQTRWIYHLNEDGSQIAQNETASGAQSPLQVMFIPIEVDPSAEQALHPQIVFQSQLSGDFSGAVNKTVLNVDGTLYREQSQLTSNGLSEPTRTVIRTLSPAEMESFKDLLINQQRFPNFDGIRYITDAAFADYPTTQLIMPGVEVSYIDLEVDNLPTSLREVIAAWDQIIQ